MTDLRARWQAVLDRARKAQARSEGRSTGVTVVGVSKRKPASAIREALEAGCVDFGENYVQELVDKAQELADASPRWHFIGHLQRNKVKALLAARPVLLHGVDSERLLCEIDKRAATLLPAPCDVLVQVNVTGEASKTGCTPEEVEPLCDLAGTLDAVRLRGLMTMPPAGDEAASRRAFTTLRELADRLGRDRLPELSMGMSQDFEIAIEEGATIVRVGTAIFGARA